MIVVFFLAACAMLVPTTLAAAADAPAIAVTVVLRDFKIDPPTLQLRVGDALALTLRNEGRVAHEWLTGRGAVRSADEKGFQQDLFAILNPKVEGRNYRLEEVGRRPPGRDERATRTSTGLEIQPGGEVTLRFTVPARRQGEWERPG